MTITAQVAQLCRCLVMMLLAASLHACGDCVTVGQAGLIVTVRDFTTARLTTSTPTLRVTEGAHVEYYAAPQSASTGTFYAATERPGVYTVLVLAEGYEAYAATDVTVGRDSKCGGVAPVQLSVRLKQLSQQ